MVWGTFFGVFFFLLLLLGTNSRLCNCKSHTCSTSVRLMNALGLEQHENSCGFLTNPLCTQTLTQMASEMWPSHGWPECRPGGERQSAMGWNGMSVSEQSWRAGASWPPTSERPGVWGRSSTCCTGHSCLTIHFYPEHCPPCDPSQWDPIPPPLPLFHSCGHPRSEVSISADLRSLS